MKWCLGQVGCCVFDNKSNQSCTTCFAVYCHVYKLPLYLLLMCKNYVNFVDGDGISEEELAIVLKSTLMAATA